MRRLGTRDWRPRP
ncbi:hypothetical protein EI555_010040 [Monodon monoceros]|uniref:Uncharacterized protein n=1 Tax=Monodon monoceros TaxID=40151 RepID=A0A4U1G010_MONMO|nr:hypothetical protein EI555_010040 [Monodon monoceros]